MNEAKSRFFANLEREMASERLITTTDRSMRSATTTTELDIDFEITESGRTVAHMVTESKSNNNNIMDDDMDFSITQSTRSTASGGMGFTESERGVLMDAFSVRSNATGGLTDMGLTDSDRGVLLETFGPESSDRLDPDEDDEDEDHVHQKPLAALPPVREARSQPVPVAPPTQQQLYQQHQQHPQHPQQRVTQTRSASQPIHLPSSNPHATSGQAPSSQPSSYGSSGSAFMSSILNPLAGLNGAPQFSHTPPAASSYEVSHFGKRPRSGSVSGKFRSASDYLEQKGLLDRQTKNILNDLCIIGDEEMQRALDQYEAGDPSELEEMIKSGALQNRLPKDIDILGGLDFDFLTVHDDQHHGTSLGDADIGELERMQQPPPPHNAAAAASSKRSQPIPVQGHADRAPHPTGAPPNMVSYDDGIGELDFAGDFVSDHTQYNMHMSGNNSNQAQSFGSSQAHPSAAASPVETQQMTEYERRNRSNSLFSALLNDPRSQPVVPPAMSQQQVFQASQLQQVVQASLLQQQQQLGLEESMPSSNGANSQNTAVMQYGEWMQGSPMDNSRPSGALPVAPQGITVGSGRAPRATATATSGLAVSLEAERKRKEKEKREQKKKDRQLKQQEKKERLARQREEEEKEMEHTTGCGRPRSLSDPNLKSHKDEFGLVQVDRPDGWVGAYSPESRRVRLDRFMEKRKHRVWTQSVKYDVRKNFADSRLRVKGRFVKKEDEMLMRELMSMT